MTHKAQEQGAGFYGLGIAPKLLSALDGMKFTAPTPIQRQAIPVACEGKNIVGIAQTGTGKTIAFAIPMIQSLAGLPHKGPRHENKKDRHGAPGAALRFQDARADRAFHGHAPRHDGGRHTHPFPGKSGKSAGHNKKRFRFGGRRWRTS